MWTDDAYKMFESWCDESGERFVLTKTAFSKRILLTFVTLESVSGRSDTDGKFHRMYKLKGL